MQIAGNPCSCQAGLQQLLLTRLPKLKEIDGTVVCGDPAAAGELPGLPDASASSCYQQAPYRSSGPSRTSSEEAQQSGDDKDGAASVRLQHLRQEDVRSEGVATEQVASSTASASCAISHTGDRTPQAKAALVCQESSCWVAGVHCLQQLRGRIMLRCSKSGSSGGQLQAGASSGTAELACCVQSPNTSLQQRGSPGKGVRLHKNVSCAQSTEVAAGGSRIASSELLHVRDGRQGSSGGSSSDSSFTLYKAHKHIGCQGPKLLSRPQSAGYIPVQPRLSCAAAPSQHMNSSSSNHQDDIDSHSRATTISNGLACSVQAAYSQHDANEPLGQRPAKPAQLRSSARQQIMLAGPPMVPAARLGLQKTLSAGASTTVAVHSPAAPRTTADNFLLDAPRVQVRRTSSNNSHSKQCGGNQKLTKIRCRHTSKSGEEPCCRAGSIRRCATHSCCAAADLAAGQQDGTQLRSIRPCRLPSLKLTLSHDAVPSAKGLVEHQPVFLEQADVGSEPQSRPRSAAGLKLAPVQHPALASAYQRQSSSSSSGRHSRTSGGLIAAFGSSRQCSCSIRASDSTGAADEHSQAVVCGAEEDISCSGSSCDSQLCKQQQPGQWSHRRNTLQDCVSVEHSTRLVSAGGEATAAAAVAGLDAVAVHARQAISSAAATMQEHLKQRLEQWRQQQKEERHQQHQQLQQENAGLRKNVALLAKRPEQHDTAHQQQYKHKLQQPAAAPPVQQLESIRLDEPRGVAAGGPQPVEVLSNALAKLTSMRTRMEQRSSHSHSGSNDNASPLCLARGMASISPMPATASSPAAGLDAAGASRVEELKARLAAANLQLQRASEAGSPAVMASSGSLQLPDIGGASASSSTSSAQVSSHSLMPGVAAVNSVAPQPVNTDEAADTASVLDAEVELLIARILKPSLPGSSNLSTAMKSSNAVAAGDDADMHAIAADIYKPSLPAWLHL